MVGYKFKFEIKNLFIKMEINFLRLFFLSFPLAILVIFKIYHYKSDFLFETSIEINKTSKDKICSLFENIELFKFHPCVREIKFIEKSKILDVDYDIYEITEEAEVFQGLHRFTANNKLYVENVDKCRIKSTLRMHIFNLFEAYFSNEIYVTKNPETENYVLLEKGKINGIYYIMKAVREYTLFYHKIMLEKIKIFLENL